MRVAAGLFVAGVLIVAGCSDSDSSTLSSASSSGGGAAVAQSSSSGGTAAGAELTPGTGVGSVNVTGARDGSFDAVSKCSLTGGDHGALLVEMVGVVGGQNATLTIDSDALQTGAYEYPTADGTGALRGDVLPEDASSGSWQFFSKTPANIKGAYNGGVITIITVTNGEQLDFTIGTEFGTTDDGGSIRLDGELRCQPILS